MTVKVELVEGTGPEPVTDQSETFKQWMFHVELLDGQERHVFGEIPYHMELTILAENLGTVTDYVAAYIQRTIRATDTDRHVYRMPNDREGLMALWEFLRNKEHLSNE